MFFSVSSYFVLQHYNPPKTKIKKELLSSNHQFQKFIQSKAKRSISSVLHEGLYIQKVNNSTKHNVPYLALTAKEVKQKNLSDIVLQRAGRICKNKGYRSAIDFNFETGKEKTKLAYFDDKNIEQLIEVKTKLKGGSIAFDSILFVFTGGLSLVVSGLSRGDYLSAAALISAELGISWGLSHVFAERIEGVKLEGMYKKYYLYFTGIDCLGAKQGISDEKITDFEVRYNCNILYDHESICNKASLREVGCLVDLSSKRNSKEICKDLVANVQDDRNLQCSIAALNNGKRLNYTMENCVNIKSDRDLQCVVTALNNGKNLDYTMENCVNIKSDRDLKCIITALNNGKHLDYTMENCVNIKSDRDLQCIIASINYGKHLDYTMENCVNIKSDRDLQCIIASINYGKHLDYTMENCVNIKSDRELKCIIASINYGKHLDYTMENCVNIKSDRDLQCIITAINNGENLDYTMENCANIQSDRELKCIIASINDGERLSSVVKNKKCK